MENQEIDPPKVNGNGKGSFWLSEEVINALIASATVTQICVYLILARYTDKTGQYSTCGKTGVRNALGVGDKQAQEVLESLTTLTVKQTDKKNIRRLVYSADEWASLTGEIIPRPTLQSQVRFYLNQFGAGNGSTGRVWFANTLVDGYGRWKRPLKDLKRLGEVAARLLLIMYREHRMEQFGGVPPYMIYHTYNCVKLLVSTGGYQLWHATRNTKTAYQTHSLPALRLEKPNGDKDAQHMQMQPFWDALAALQAKGFVYEVVTVLDAEPGSRDANVVYELDAISLHGYRPKGEEGLARDTATLAAHWGYGGMWGRSGGNYAVFIEQGVTPHVAGIFRLRFRVANPKNHTISAAFQRIGTDRAEWRHILENLLAPFQTSQKEALQEEK